MTTRLLVGDVFERMRELPDHSFDLILTSPPFLALRSYLPDDHPDKHLEIGSEATPADYLDTLLALTAEWRRLLAPHGSIAIELGDTYSGSGGAGGDYDEGGIRDGQPKFRQFKDAPQDEVAAGNHRFTGDGYTRSIRNMNNKIQGGGPGWPLDKSLTGIPTLYAWSLAYGRNLLTGQESPAGRWRIRNLKPWIRSNPPVGVLGDKERPATSYITVACVGASRWFDLDAVRTPSPAPPKTATPGTKGPNLDRGDLGAGNFGVSPGGAPPLDWWHHVDAVIDNVINQRAGKPNGNPRGPASAGGLRTAPEQNTGSRGDDGQQHYSIGVATVGARGVHVRRALTEAGLLPPGDFYDVSPRGYSGAHYAVWPPELVRLLIDEMCPRRVCRECGEPSRRIVNKLNNIDQRQELAGHIRERREAAGLSVLDVAAWFPSRTGGLTGCVSNWETANNVPTTQQWPVLKDRLGLSDEFDDLVLGERRWTESTATYTDQSGRPTSKRDRVDGDFQGSGSAGKRDGGITATHQTLGWSDCGCPGDHWRPGRVLDPFSGSGTTLAVASGMGRDSVGIDLDPRNADLTLERVGMFLEVDYGTKEATA